MISAKEIVDALQPYIELFKSIAVIIPVAWVVFVFCEWLLMRQYYSICCIERFFHPNYKIALNPRYLASLFMSIMVWTILYGIHFITSCVECPVVIKGIIWGILVIVLLIWPLIELARSCEVDKLQEKGEAFLKLAPDERPASNKTGLKKIIVSLRKKVGNVIIDVLKLNSKKEGTRDGEITRSEGDNYREDIWRWSSLVEKLRVLRAAGLSIILLLLMEGGRLLLDGAAVNLAQFLILCLIWHWLLYVDYTLHHREQLTQSRISIAFRKLHVIDFNKKTYVLLTHPNCDSNQISVAVRAIIVSSESKKVNNAYLFPGDIVTGKAPATGESYVVDIDFTKIFEKSIITDKGQTKYNATSKSDSSNSDDQTSSYSYKILKNRTWKNLSDYMSEDSADIPQIVLKALLEERNDGAVSETDTSENTDSSGQEKCISTKKDKEKSREKRTGR